MQFFIGAFISLILFFSVKSHAEFEVPSLRGPVMDQVGVLSGSVRQELSQLLFDFNRRGKAQIQVLIIDSLQGEAIEAASIRVADKWQLGDKKKDNGVLFLIAMQEHRVRIEVGRGLEGAIPDIYAKRIVSDKVVPLFRKKKYSEGIYAGTAQIMALADKEFADEKNLSARSERTSPKTIIILFIVFGLFAFIIIAARNGGGGYGGGGGWSDGGGGWPSGGGSNNNDWSGGGGGFSGGGASGDWNE
jgi:uncharacterized protein